MGDNNPKIFFIGDCITIAEDLGYRDKFLINARGIFREHNRYVYSPDEIKVQSHFHFKIAEAHPGSYVFYLLETSDGKRGFLAADDTEFSDTRIRDFIREANYHEDSREHTAGWMARIQHFLKEFRR